VYRNGFLSGWWGDFINIIVAGATITATFLSLAAIVYSAVLANRTRSRLIDERRRLHEIDTLGRILEFATSARRAAPDLRAPAFATVRTLSQSTRARIPMTRGFFDPIPMWRIQTYEQCHMDFRGKEHPIAELHLTHYDTVTGDDGITSFERTVMDAIYDEIIEAMNVLVSERFERRSVQ
jgi:hypothetical protein